MVYAAVIGAALLLALSMFALRKRAVSRRRLAAASQLGTSGAASSKGLAAREEGDLVASARAVDGGGAAAPGSERERWLEQEVEDLHGRLEAILAALRSKQQ